MHAFTRTFGVVTIFSDVIRQLLLIDKWLCWAKTPATKKLAINQY